MKCDNGGPDLSLGQRSFAPKTMSDSEGGDMSKNMIHVKTYTWFSAIPKVLHKTKSFPCVAIFAAE